MSKFEVYTLLIGVFFVVFILIVYIWLVIGFRKFFKLNKDDGLV